MTLTAVQDVVGFLERAGLVTSRLGSYSRRKNPFAKSEIGSGYQSRIRAGPRLIALLEEQFGVSLAGVGVAKVGPGRLIRLRAAAATRGAAKRSLRFQETPATRLMVERLTASNSLRAGCSFSFAGTAPIRFGKAHTAPANADVAAVHLYRTFNNGRWDHGGRHFGGWWYNMPKADRSRILIDGETTVELDFGACHPRLCYHLVGQPLPTEADPYVIAGYETAIYRPVAKQAFGQLLNTSPGGKPQRSGDEMKALFRTAKEYAAFIGAVEAAFQPVQEWLRAGRGLELQFIDSQIAEAVMETLTVQGIPCLPVHDSFIVPASAEVALGRAMYSAYERVLAALTQVQGLPVIKGWSAAVAAHSALQTSSHAHCPSLI